MSQLELKYEIDSEDPLVSSNGGTTTVVDRRRRYCLPEHYIWITLIISIIFTAYAIGHIGDEWLFVHVYPGGYEKATLGWFTWSAIDLTPFEAQPRPVLDGLAIAIAQATHVIILFVYTPWILYAALCSNEHQLTISLKSYSFVAPWTIIVLSTFGLVWFIHNTVAIQLVGYQYSVGNGFLTYIFSIFSHVLVLFWYRYRQS
jgi:hypothetical protein